MEYLGHLSRSRNANTPLALPFCCGFGSERHHRQQWRH